MLLVLVIDAGIVMVGNDGEVEEPDLLEEVLVRVV